MKQTYHALALFSAFLCLALGCAEETTTPTPLSPDVNTTDTGNTSTDTGGSDDIQVEPLDIGGGKEGADVEDASGTGDSVDEETSDDAGETPDTTPQDSWDNDADGLDTVTGEDAQDDSQINDAGREDTVESGDSSEPEDTADSFDDIEEDGSPDTWEEPDAGPIACDPPLSLYAETNFANPFELKLLSPQGGTGAYLFEFATDEDGVELNGSGAILNSLTGAYLAGSETGTQDTIRLTDSGCVGEAYLILTVAPPMTLSPNAATLPPATSFQLTFQGGSGDVTFSAEELNTGGSITPDGFYTAGDLDGIDTVRIDDLQTGESDWAILTVDANASLTTQPELMGLSLGSFGSFSVNGGSGFFSVKVANPDLALWDGETLTGLQEGKTHAKVTDLFTGQEATLYVQVAKSLTYSGERAGENQVTGVVLYGGDLNNDGYADVILASHDVSHASWRDGVVHIYAGNGDGTMTLVRTLSGLNRLEQFGKSAAVADLNQDGLMDLVIGSDRADYGFTDNGAILIYHGEEGTFFEETPAQVLLGPEGSARLGSAIGICDVNGDGRLDIAAGLQLMEHPVGDQGTNSQGALFVWLGYPDGFLPESDAQRYGMLPDGVGGWEFNQALEMGISMTTGDFNADGLCDIAIGALEYKAPGGGNDHGAVFIYGGMAPDMLTLGGITEHPYRILAGTEVGSGSGWFGRFLKGGDIDGDGIDDLAIGQPLRHLFGDNSITDRGAIHVYLGADGEPVPAESIEGESAADWSMQADNNNDRIGNYVNLAELDGKPGLELIVSERDGEAIGGVGGAGVVHILGLPLQPTEDPSIEEKEGGEEGEEGEEEGGEENEPLPFSLEIRESFGGETATDYFGYSFDIAGDQNGDGLMDLFVFAARNDALGYDVGRPYLVLRGEEPSLVPLEYPGLMAGNRFGYSVAIIPDFTQDGIEDVLVGERYYDNILHGMSIGKVHLFAGDNTGIQSTSIDSWWNFEGFSKSTLSGSYDQFGMAVAHVGDFNGDGLPDMAAVASSGESPGSINTSIFVEEGTCGAALNAQGAVYILPGSSEGPPEQKAITIGFGLVNDTIEVVEGNLDINGDGFMDVLVGAPLSDLSTTNTGLLYVLYGRPSELDGRIQLDCTMKAIDVFEGPETTSQFGRSISKIGDLNSDGCDDFVVGGHGTDLGLSNQGALFLIYGWGGVGCPEAPLQTALVSGRSGAQAGYGMDAGEDVDGDGIPDIAVGGFTNTVNNSQRGSVWLIPGSYLMTLPVEPLLSFTSPGETHPFNPPAVEGQFRADGESVGGQFGKSVVLVPGGGDSGRAAVAVSSPLAESEGVTKAGEVWVFKVPEDAPLSGLVPIPFAIFKGSTTAPDGLLGEFMDGGEIDGRPSIAIGEQYGTPLSNEQERTQTGSAYIFDLNPTN